MHSVEMTADPLAAKKSVKSGRSAQLVEALPWYAAAPPPPLPLPRHPYYHSIDYYLHPTFVPSFLAPRNPYAPAHYGLLPYGLLAVPASASDSGSGSGFFRAGSAAEPEDQETRIKLKDKLELLKLFSLTVAYVFTDTTIYTSTESATRYVYTGTVTTTTTVTSTPVCSFDTSLSTCSPSG